MRIKLMRKLEVYIKGKINRLKINKDDFTIISNNCWGILMYKKFGLKYNSPFINLFLFADDYIKLLKRLSPESLQIIKFIDRKESKYIDEINKEKGWETFYPIGILSDNIEVHFLHYTSEEDALKKWNERCERINWDKLLVKFSDGYACKDEHIKDFDSLHFEHKVCFTAKPFEELKSIVYIEKFAGQQYVVDEWKLFHKHYDIVSAINNL